MLGRAVLLEVDAVVRASYSDEVPCRVFGVAGLHDVPADQATLRQADHVELRPLEGWIALDLVTGLVCLAEHRGKDARDVSVADLNALHMRVRR